MLSVSLNETFPSFLSGILNCTICSLMCNVVSDPDVARLIILLDLKCFAGKLFNQVLVLVGGFICRKLMTKHGSMEL